MADVELVVAVKSAGVGDAINQLENLKNKGLQTASSLNGLSTATDKVMSAVTKASGATGVAVTKMEGYGLAMDHASRATAALNQELAKQEKIYASQARLNPGATARERLTRLGGAGGLAAGMNTAAQVQARNDARAASMTRDLITVQREEQAMLSARQSKLSAMASVEQATWNASLRGMTAAEQAAARLARAQEELARAQKAVNDSFIRTRGKGGQFLPYTESDIKRQATALNELATAITGVERAQTGLDNHKGNGNAFQSSFSYFILAGLAQQASQAILGVASATVTASAQIERSFADVDRTFEGTERQLGHLKERLRELSTETPISFIDLSQMAALGNQLGVAAEDIEAFTQTIAQYSTISGQSAEDAATAFGRISNLTGLAASQYSNLGSAITYVARTSVATESTIQNTAKEITALASGAGFSADAIVGLAGALSSLAIPPERARGALSLYFGALNGAVAEGGPKLEAFAELTGKTTEELGRLVRENKGQEVFQAFISGLSQLDTVAKTTALDTLGLSTIRVDQTMRALAQNVPLVTKSFEGANAAFEANTELAEQYATIQDTLMSKWGEFQNAIQNAAGAVGDALAPALMDLLTVTTDIIVAFTDFAKTDVGKAMIGIAGGVTALILAFTTLVGILALTKATMVVIPWALQGLAATGARGSIIQFTLALLGMNTTLKAGAVENVAFAGTMKATDAASRSAAVGLRIFRGALAATGIGLAIVLISTLAEAMMNTSEAAKISSSDVAGLAEAIRTDTATYQESGKAIATYSAEAAKSVDDQKNAAAESRNWAFILGNELVGGAEAAQEAISKIAAGDAVTEVFRTALGDKQEVKDIISDSGFASNWKKFGLDMTSLIAAGLQDDGSGKKVQDALDEMLGGITTKTFSGGSGNGAYLYQRYYDAAGNEVTDFYEQLQDLVPIIASEGAVMQETANSGFVLGDATLRAAEGAGELGDGFLGAADGLTAYQDAVGAALGEFTSFSNILDRVKDAAAEKAGDDDGLLARLVNADAFGQELRASTDQAVNFFNNLQALAATGASELAQQFASLGPGSAGILADTLAMTPEARAGLEADARFAAFLASDAFKRAFEAEMTTTNDAYALIFKQTGSLDKVKEYIAAQVAGTGAEWEKQWAIQNPTATLNVTPDLINPSAEDLAVYSAMLSGRITVTPVIKYRNDNDPRGAGTANKYTDTQTGATITLPANLDQKSLNASLAVWATAQAGDPEQIAAKINTSTFSADLNNWIKQNGPVTVYARIKPTSITDPEFLYGSNPLRRKDGGIIPGFAGGGYLRGPGTPTSDSMLIRASRNEYMQSADSTKFWGVNFMDSLNKKMLPASFAAMLGAAAVSGNSGPTHVAHVNVMQNNPLTRDPLVQLREKSEALAAGIWGDGE